MTHRQMRNRFEKWIEREDPHVILTWESDIQRYASRTTHLLWMAFWQGSLLT